MEDYDYSFETPIVEHRNKVFVLIIYDICDNKTRVKLAKFLQGYGFRIQKSAFEAYLTKDKYRKLLGQIGKYVTDEDSIRVYKIQGKGQVTSFGKKVEKQIDDIIVI